jgi:UTP--glucose-1-phosphate uridylyltransferase
MKRVKKAIIPAAGLGTRFLPATKAMPKEMLPIIDRPTIDYIVEEAKRSGIEDIIIVTGKGKRAIEDHFDKNIELEDNLIKKGKHALLEKIQPSSNVEIHYIRQKEPRGLGNAVWCARKFIGNEPFAVLLGDDIVRAETPGIKQLIMQFEKLGSSIIGVQEIPVEESERYGIVEPDKREGRLHSVNKFVEKPKLESAPSNLAIMGRYVLTPAIFDLLENQVPGAGGEIQLTDAINRLNELEQVYAYQLEGNRYDVGDKMGFLRTTVDFALENSEFSGQVEQMLRELLEKYHSQEVVR